MTKHYNMNQMQRTEKSKQSPDRATDVCGLCGGKISYKPIPKDGLRKPALKGKRTCDACGYWPTADAFSRPGA